MRYLKNRFNDFIHDQWQWSSCIANAVLVYCFNHFMIDGVFKLEPLFYGTFFSVYILVVFLFGRKAIPIMFLCFCYLGTQDINFKNCTIFILLLGLSKLWPKVKIPLIVFYVIDVFIVCFRHDTTEMHLLAHFTLCVIFYWFFELIVKTIQDETIKKMRELEEKSQQVYFTAEECAILDELVKGVKQVDVDGYSKSTVHRKLKECKLRTGCNSTRELKELYRDYLGKK